MVTMKKRTIICVVGPTASGKTDLSIQLALRFNGEVVSCDSMQIYRKMSIGTAKPTEDEKCGIPHHMIDIVDPSEPYSVAQYVTQASSCIEDIIARERTPIICGGTGMYLDALLYGLHEVAEQSECERKKLNDRVKTDGLSSLYDELCSVDPKSALRIDANNERRIIRALEVFHATGIPLTRHHEQSRQNPVYDSLILGISFPERRALYERINYRVELMMDAGLLDEVRMVNNLQPPPCYTSMQAIGYKEFAGVLTGEMSIEMAVSNIKQSSRRLAKRQITWFKKTKGIHWLEADVCNVSQSLLEQSLQIIKLKDYK